MAFKANPKPTVLSRPVSSPVKRRRETMRVAVYYNNRDVRIASRAVPKVGPGELLVRICSSGICGTDVMEWYRIRKAPLVLGHEITGEIVQVGEGIKHFHRGDRVFSTHHVPCNKCRYCLTGHETVCDTIRSTHFDPGGFSEYVRIPKINVDVGTFILPEQLSFDEGSFIEPLACVVRSHKRAQIRPGQTALVIGCGVAGLLHLRLARANGSKSIIATDVNHRRLQLARACGAMTVPADGNVAEALRSMNEGRLADVVIVCSGADAAIEQGFQSLERGGTLLFFATSAEGIRVPMPLYELWRDEAHVTTSYAASREDIVDAIGYLKEKRVRVGSMITHRLGLEEIGTGFQLVASADDSVKVIIKPHLDARRHD